jgi:Flp pilus assembly protein TadG
MPSLREFWREQSGNFGLLTAILLVPVIGAVGLAIDVSHALSLRTELIGIADSAALGAISENSAGLKAAKAMANDGEIAVAQDDGRKLFLSQRGGSVAADIREVGLKVSMKVTRKSGSISSIATFSADVPTTFMRILGQETIPISGTATAAYGAEAKSYTNFYMLLDNTPSMGIAATTKEMARLISLTSNKCAFACHIGWSGSDGKFNEDANSTYIVARKNNVKLRVDVVADAAAALIKKIQYEMANSADQYRIATYSFGKYALEPGYRIDKVSALTVDMTSAAKATSDMALMTTDHDWFNDNALTSFDTALTAIGKEIGSNGGAGTSAADPQKIVYFVTDGVADSLKPGGNCGGSWHDEKGRCLEPIDTKYCQALKDRDIKIAVLYTTYIPLDGDHTWDAYIKNAFASKIGPKLKECASSGLFFEVGPDEDMQAAMVALFVKAASSMTGLRLTQ